MERTHASFRVVPFNQAIAPAGVVPLLRPLPPALYVPNKGYYWPIASDEATRISSLLDFDIESLRVAGHWVNSPALVCYKCNKVSGLDDFIYGALKDGVHDAEFMVNALKEGPRGTGMEHVLHCCNCDTMFVEPVGLDKSEGPSLKRVSNNHGHVSAVLIHHCLSQHARSLGLEEVEDVLQRDIDGEFGAPFLRDLEGME